VLQVDGPAPVIFMIYPEPRTDRYLVTLDRPVLVTGIRNEQTDDQMYIARSAIDHRFRFEVRASPGAGLKVQGGLDRNFYLQTPAEITPRMQRLADEIRHLSDDVKVRIESLAEFFRNQGLSYDQEDLPTGPDAIDNFLFETKRGYCEFFASAYVTLARLAGIPARLVGGYFGGDYNPLGGYYLVSEDAAHIWVEVLSADNNWQRVDPSQWATNAATTLGVRDRNPLSRLRQLADSLNYQWVQAIVVFDLQQQMTLFHEAGKQLRGFRSIRFAEGWWKAFAGLLLVSSAVAIVMIRPRGSKEARLLAELRTLLRKRYRQISWSPGTGLSEIADQLDSDACREFARIYYGAIFRDRTLTPQEFQHLKNLLKRI